MQIHEIKRVVRAENFRVGSAMQVRRSGVVGTVMSQIEKGIRPEVPDSLNATVANIIQKGWAVNPAVRYSFDEI
jgi:hypothetical protein